MRHEQDKMDFLQVDVWLVRFDRRSTADHLIGIHIHQLQAVDGETRRHCSLED